MATASEAMVAVVGELHSDVVEIAMALVLTATVVAATVDLPSKSKSPRSARLKKIRTAPTKSARRRYVSHSLLKPRSFG